MMSVEFQVCILVFRLRMLRALHSDVLDGRAIVRHCGGRRDSSCRLFDVRALRPRVDCALFAGPRVDSVFLATMTDVSRPKPNRSHTPSTNMSHSIEEHVSPFE